MSTFFLRNTTERPGLLKQVLGKVLPLSLKRHVLYVKHYRRIGNFRKPTLFSEKMQWRIINDRRDLLQFTCDKVASRNIAAKTAASAGFHLKFPRQLAWSDQFEIFVAKLHELQRNHALPSKWVVKPNHSSGRALVIEGEPDWHLIEQTARKWLAPSRFTGLHWIWPYANAEEGLLAEEYISSNGPLIEWQLWVFDGKVRFIVVQERTNGELRRSTYDYSWNAVEPWYNNKAQPVQLVVPPENWHLLERTALELASGWEMIRVDLFDDRWGGIWFGELTPFAHEGLMSTSESTRIFDETAGEMWRLPSI